MATTQARRDRTAIGYAACALAGCLWSAGFYFGKVALTAMGVAHMVLYRFLFACLALSPILFGRGIREAKSLSGGEWRALLLASFLGVPVQFLIQFQGLSLTSVSHAALMVGTMPVILALGATIFSHERLDKSGWLALCGSTLGVALIVFSGSGSGSGGARSHPADANSPHLAGDLLVVVSLFLSLGWILINQRLMKRHAPLVITAYGLLAGTAMLAAWVLAVDGPPPVRGVGAGPWLALAASGVLCTATTTLLWNWGIHRVPASRAGVFLNIEPALGSVLGVELLGDKLGPLTWVGGALILAAAALLTSRGRVEVEGVLE